MERLPATAHLALAAMLVSVLVAIPVGVLSATRPNSIFDQVGRLLNLAGQSIPLFWLGIMFVLVFSVKLRWLPVAGRLEPTSIILPALTLGMYPMARIARVLRASMLQVLVMDYCRTARAKGLAEGKVVTRHALRNAALPVVTVMGLQFGYLLGGAVVTETIFAWPGLGWLTYFRREPSFRKIRQLMKCKTHTAEERDGSKTPRELFHEHHISTALPDYHQCLLWQGSSYR